MTASEFEAATRVRTYGGWRRARGMGLFGLSSVGTVVVLACLVTPLVIGAASLQAGLIAAVPAGLVVLVTLLRVDGVTVGQVLQRTLRWWWGSLRGYGTFRSGAVVEHADAWRLPGALAPLTLLSADDGRGGSYGVVWDRRTGFLTATLRCAAASTWLVDGQDADAWVSNWHSWLASLGYTPAIRWVAVTVDTAPEPGTTLQEQVLGRVDPRAPHDADALMRELVARSPAAAADVETRVSITFNPAATAHRHDEPEAQVAAVGRLLVGLESALGSCGVTVLGRASADDVAAWVRIAFDPAARGEVQCWNDSAPAAGRERLPWAEAGPVAALEEWDRYRHDSGISVSWGWHEPPRQQVTSGVLTRLLSPGRFAKRVTVLYRPLPAGEAARILEEQVNAAAFRDAYRKAQKRDETARDAADRMRAQQAAREEAQGAGVVLMSMYVTATVQDEVALPAAVADIESRADQSKIRVRRLFGSQAAGFAATLPVGIHPVQLATRGQR
jgi:hypothetical protein